MTAEELNSLIDQTIVEIIINGDEEVAELVTKNGFTVKVNLEK